MRPSSGATETLRTRTRTVTDSELYSLPARLQLQSLTLGIFLYTNFEIFFLSLLRDGFLFDVVKLGDGGLDIRQ